MSGKRVLLLFFALLFLAVGFIFWVGATGGGTANRPAGTAGSASPATQSAPEASSP